MPPPIIRPADMLKFIGWFGCEYGMGRLGRHKRREIKLVRRVQARQNILRVVSPKALVVGCRFPGGELTRARNDCSKLSLSSYILRVVRRMLEKNNEQTQL